MVGAQARLRVLVQLSPTVLNRETWRICGLRSGERGESPRYILPTSSLPTLGLARANRQAAWPMAWYFFRFAPVVGETDERWRGAKSGLGRKGKAKRVVMAKASQQASR